MGRERLAQKGDPMTTQPESGSPESGSTGSASPGSGGITSSEYGSTQPQSSESKEGQGAGALTRWPRDLMDMWSGWQPFGAVNWPFRDIKVEEYVEGDQLVIRAEVPGVDPDRDIDVSVDNGVLTISAERRESNREKFGDRGFHTEFRYGSFVRQVRLPAGTSPEVVSATYKDGVLEIRMPKPTAEAASRRIQIQRG
jgi:HSP20 family protein